MVFEAIPVCCWACLCIWHKHSLPLHQDPGPTYHGPSNHAPCGGHLHVARVRDVMMDAILLPYMGTGEALDATYLLCVVQATN